ncbi:MAG: hypothetical protein AAF741_13270 [Bacteroidota bacterium]
MAQSQPLSDEAFAFIKSKEDSMAFYAYALLHDSTAEERFLACRELIPSLVESLKQSNSFQYDFERLGQHVSIQYPADSSFRIFTWQLHVSAEEYRYYGAIQLNNTELKLFPLIDRSFELPEEEIQNMPLSPDRWYGNVVYDIQTVENENGESYYLLYGADTYSAYRRRKLLDVLQFNDDKAVFGKPIFPATPGSLPRHRLVLEYSAAVSVTLRYDTDLEQIMMDHLIMVEGPHGEGPVFVPDGSYEAFKLENDGNWSYVEKVFDHIYEEAPREQPTSTNAKDRDIFGRPRG